MVGIVQSFCGNSPIGASPTARSRLTKNHTATPAITAVLTPAPNRGRMAAYTHSRPTPYTKSSTTNNGMRLSVAPGLPSAWKAAAKSPANHFPYMAKSTTLSTTPVSNPPSTTRPQLILPIAHLAEGGQTSTRLRHYEPTQPPSSIPPCASSLYGTTSNATIPPNPSGTVATPLGTTQSDPSTCRLKW